MEKRWEEMQDGWRLRNNKEAVDLQKQVKRYESVKGWNFMQ